MAAVLVPWFGLEGFGIGYGGWFSGGLQGFSRGFGLEISVQLMFVGELGCKLVGLF